MTEKNNLDDERAVLFGRFKKSGIAALSELEMLKMLLFSILPHRCVDSAAYKLFKEFGSLKNVLFAPADELKGIEGLGLNAALWLRFIGAVSGCLNQTPPLIKEVFASFDNIAQYCVKHFENEGSEVLTLFLFSDKNALLHIHNIGSAMPNQIAANYREIVGEIYEYDCRKVVIAHNHPNGTVNPSDSDIIRTRELGGFFKIIGVELVDHIIVCGNKAKSLQNGRHTAEEISRR